MKDYVKVNYDFKQAGFSVEFGGEFIPILARYGAPFYLTVSNINYPITVEEEVGLLKYYCLKGQVSEELYVKFKNKAEADGIGWWLFMTTFIEKHGDHIYILQTLKPWLLPYKYNTEQSRALPGSITINGRLIQLYASEAEPMAMLFDGADVLISELDEINLLRQFALKSSVIHNHTKRIMGKCGLACFDKWKVFISSFLEKHDIHQTDEQWSPFFDYMQSIQTNFVDCGEKVAAERVIQKIAAGWDRVALIAMLLTIPCCIGALIATLCRIPNSTAFFWCQMVLLAAIALPVVKSNVLLILNYRLVRRFRSVYRANDTRADMFNGLGLFEVFVTIVCVITRQGEISVEFMFLAPIFILFGQLKCFQKKTPSIFT